MRDLRDLDLNLFFPHAMCFVSVVSGLSSSPPAEVFTCADGKGFKQERSKSSNADLFEIKMYLWRLLPFWAAGVTRQFSNNIHYLGAHCNNKDDTFVPLLSKNETESYILPPPPPCPSRLCRLSQNLLLLPLKFKLIEKIS